MEEQQDLLSDLEQEISFEPATKGQRFVNYIIDLIVFYIFFFIIGAAIGVGMAVNHTELDTESGGTTLFFYVLAYIVIVLVYTIFEGASKGKTLGKLITGTRAIKEDGSPITWNDALIRSLCRIVPFEPFSALGDIPWHDKWSKTRVVKRK